MRSADARDVRVDLRRKTAIVTGAATGIGRAIALRFGASGANVVIDHRGKADRAALIATEIERHGGHALAVEADVSDEKAAPAGRHAP